jgi:hypothetical protein
MENELFTILIIGLIFLISFGLKLLVKNIKRRLKGVFGEFKVKLRLKWLNSKKYKVLNNILIQKGNCSSQIDHVVVSNYGIFVIETKNFKGWIFGHEKSEKWTHTLFKNKYQFRNPVKQVWGHVNSLKRILNNYSNASYYPIVVFAGSGKLKKITSSTPVFRINRLLRYIRRKSKEEILLDYEVIEIVNIITSLNVVKNRPSKKKHIAKAKVNKSRRRVPTICPTCGGKLNIKKGKFGSFYGCSNYPNCKFTQKIK